MNQPASLRSDHVAGIPWNGWPTCSGLSGRNRLDYVADFTGMRVRLHPPHSDFSQPPADSVVGANLLKAAVAPSRPSRRPTWVLYVGPTPNAV
jgi:hypothetical protein